MRLTKTQKRRAQRKRARDRSSGALKLVCERKIRYKTELAANVRATTRGGETNEIYRSYQCSICNKFHLTSDTEQTYLRKRHANYISKRSDTQLVYEEENVRTQIKFLPM